MGDFLVALAFNVDKKKLTKHLRYIPNVSLIKILSNYLLVLSKKKLIIVGRRHLNNDYQ